MNGRRLFREYAQSKGKEAKEFVEIISEFGDYSDTLITKSDSGQIESSSLDYKEMVHWVIKTK